MRIEFEVETEIERPPAAVFDVLTDPDRLSLWDPRVVEAFVVGGGPLRQGSRVREIRRLGPRRLAQTVVVAAHERPHRFDLRILEGPVPVHADLRLEDYADGATRVRLRAHGSVPGPQPLAPLVRWLAAREMRSQYRRLKRLLEADEAA